MLHVSPVGARTADRVRAKQGCDQALEGSDYEHVETRVAEGSDVVGAVLEEAEGGYDLIVTGATEGAVHEPAHRQHRRADRPPGHSDDHHRQAQEQPAALMMRQTVLEPTAKKQAVESTSAGGRSE